MDCPRNVVVILLDSLGRQHLGAYGGDHFSTPNLDQFAQTATRFMAHHSGSLPCMPARHDLWCGVWDFLWRPWGSIELWDEPLPVLLRERGVVTKLVSDHPHLFESGGENYHVDFTAWEYLRGHEGDPWRTRADPSWQGAPDFGRGRLPYDNSRGWFRGEEDFPGPRTMQAAARWLEQEAPQDGRFFLLIDEFDPHEPFDTPEPWASMYDGEWEGVHLVWPPYCRDGVARGILTSRQAVQVRAQYGSKLSMIDHWLGRVLSVLERTGHAQDTAVVVMTDHGIYLGEHDIWGKPAAPLYGTLSHLPLLIRWPGMLPRSIEALTTTVDLYATLLEWFGVEVPRHSHGRSLLPLLRGETSSHHPWILTGVWGREVGLITPEWRYSRAPAGENAPLSIWSNRWSTMPIRRHRHQAMPPPDARARLQMAPHSAIPVITQRLERHDPAPYWARATFSGHHLFAWRQDGEEQVNRAGSPEEILVARLLHQVLAEVEAPVEQLERLGLSS